MLNGVTSDAHTAAVGVAAVTKRFGDVVAVDNLSFEVGDGEFFSMLGPSGCGKTTMLRMIAGLDLPSNGDIRIFGAQVADTPPNKRPVNTVFQQYALFPHLSVADNVGFGLRMQKVAKADRLRQVAEILSLVRLDGLDQRKPSQLSGGQQQRVALARALVNRPKVLLLDEPLGALDLKLRQEMQIELKALQRELGITFIFVTHDQDEALTMSDRIAVMNAGRILQLAPPEEIYENPADRFVAGFIGQSNVLDATVADTGADGMVVLGNGSRLAADTRGHVPGTNIALAIRPERITIGGAASTEIAPRTDATAGAAAPPATGSTLTGIVSAATYLGTAISYRVAIEWMRLDVRVENRNDDRLEVGAAVEVSWEPSAVSVLAGNDAGDSHASNSGPGKSGTIRTDASDDHADENGAGVGARS